MDHPRNYEPISYAELFGKASVWRRAEFVVADHHP